MSGLANAPTAPVEASGSEREHGPKCWGKTSISDEMMYCYCGSTDSPSGETREALGGQKGDSETLRVLLDNLVIAQTLSKDIRQKATDEARSYLYDLRHTPQPSGETREVETEVQYEVWGAGPQGDFCAASDMLSDAQQYAAVYGQDGPVVIKVATTTRVEWTKDLLSARPLALGGQQGGIPSATEATLVAYEDAHAVAVEMGYPSLTEALEHLSELTTPARAEAQDEGAAGEPVAWRWRYGEGDWHVGTAEPDAHIFLNTKGPDEIQPLYAHPSPTPAADADRVREAIALAEYVCGLLPSLAGAADQPDNKVYAAYANKGEIMGARARLAALKSTAASHRAEINAMDDNAAYASERIEDLKSTAAKEGEKS